MSTTEKGNRLEDRLLKYLLDQTGHDELVYGLYPAGQCRVLKQAKYYCRDREADVEFDIVVEIRRQGASDPHLYLVFECKNHKRSIEDKNIRNFSDQLISVFGHAAKGIIVTTNKLQSGAYSVANKRKLGIVKFDSDGIEIVAERTARSWVEEKFIDSQLYSGSGSQKSLKFSAHLDGCYFS
ncbi:restriction endonuclease [Roseinatronobacter ekhonensis]|uniref:restriction endonuclease n=1 Tax=Roseinatronobacter ekhonensis TaxID=254356 RepID=UPI001600EC2F|nr:restriction endonuclease [Roseibaca ekhonensis]